MLRTLEPSSINYVLVKYRPVHFNLHVANSFKACSYMMLYAKGVKININKTLPIVIYATSDRFFKTRSC